MARPEPKKTNGTVAIIALALRSDEPKLGRDRIVSSEVQVSDPSSCASSRSASPGRRSTPSCSASTTTTPTPPATSGWGPRRRSAGRDIGMDFAGKDGWRMYHGDVVPGLPAAPAPRLRDRHHRAPRPDRPLRLARRHRALRPGRRAVADRRHGHRALRDVPAASSATAPTRSSCSRSGSTCRAADKMVEPYFTMLWADDDPRARRRRRRGPHDRGHRHRRRARRRRRRPRRRRARGRRAPDVRRRDLDDRAASPARAWTLPPGAARHQPHALLLRGDAVAASTGTSSCGRDAGSRAPRRRCRSPLRERPRGRRAACSCRAGRSASRSRSTARS